MKNFTQKQWIAMLQAQAQGLGLTVAIRKNSYGEYESRIRTCGPKQVVLLDYFGDTFEDAVQTVKSVLAEAQDEVDAQEREADKQYARDLQNALDHAQVILSLVGCRLDVDAQDTVTLISPRTGSHSLCMKRGVRPVSDLLTHTCGFAEQQTHTHTFPLSR